MKRYLVAAMLAVALCAATALLSGCGGGGDDDEENTDASPTKTTQPVHCTTNPEACK